MRVLVCGSRDYKNKQFLFDTLDNFHAQMPISMIINGGQTGADTLAREWAESRKINCRTFNARWTALGGKAGPIRNAQMLREAQPELVIAFPGNNGTANMKKQAKKAGVPILTVAD